MKKVLDESGSEGESQDQSEPQADAPAQSQPSSDGDEHRSVELGDFAVWAVIVAVIALWIGAGIGGDQAGEANSGHKWEPVTTASGVDFSRPPGSKRMAPPEHLLKSLGISNIRAYTLPEDTLGSAIVGTSSGTGPTLLSAAGLAHLQNLSSPEVVEVGRYAAVHVTGTLASGGVPVTVYSVPTTAGVVNVVCVNDASALESCEHLSTTLAISRPKSEPIALTTIEEDLTTIRKTVASYEAQVLSLRKQLARASYGAEQADVAEQLGVLCLKTAVKVAHLSSDPVVLPAQLSLHKGLVRAAAAYYLLHRAAVDGGRRVWVLGRGQVLRAERIIAVALRQVPLSSVGPR